MIDILSEDFVIPNYAGDLQEIIDYQLDNRPNKNDKNYSDWCKMMNKLIDAHTKCVKFKAYKTIYR
jgi:hypothetical protein